MKTSKNTFQKKEKNKKHEKAFIFIYFHFWRLICRTESDSLSPTFFFAITQLITTSSLCSNPLPKFLYTFLSLTFFISTKTIFFHSLSVFFQTKPSSFELCFGLEPFLSFVLHKQHKVPIFESDPEFFFSLSCCKFHGFLQLHC